MFALLRSDQVDAVEHFSRPLRYSGMFVAADLAQLAHVTQETQDTSIFPRALAFECLDEL